MIRKRIAHTATAALLAVVAAGPADVFAKPPKTVGSAAPPACGLKALPLAKGNSWAYRSGNSQVLIKVVDVVAGKDAAGKPGATITLEETTNGRVITTTAVCSAATGLQLPLDSFFFSGEPGGSVNATTTITAREKATLLPDDQIVGDNGWVESVKAEVARTDQGAAGAKHPPANVEIERHVNVKDSDKVMISLGQFNAHKIIFEIRGRGIVGEERVEIPIKRPGTAYLAKGVGYVKIDDVFDRTWELIDTNLVAK
jgi:hypothetical protein